MELCRRLRRPGHIRPSALSASGRNEDWLVCQPYNQLTRLFGHHDARDPLAADTLSDPIGFRPSGTDFDLKARSGSHVTGFGTNHHRYRVEILVIEPDPSLKQDRGHRSILAKLSGNGTMD